VKRASENAKWRPPLSTAPLDYHPSVAHPRRDRNIVAAWKHKPFERFYFKGKNREELAMYFSDVAGSLTYSKLWV
jgi:hypothetical protein